MFLPGVYETKWYNDRPFSSPEGYISSREAFLVGMPRLKQIRVKEGKEHNYVRTVFLTMISSQHIIGTKKMVERIKQKFGKIIHKQFTANIKVR